jgi:uncharacterized protein (DUF1330 family)
VIVEISLSHSSSGYECNRLFTTVIQDRRKLTLSDGGIMAKGYWITFYRAVSNPAALAQYAKLAEPAIQAGGGRFLTRGTAVRAFEAGIKERSIVIEFDSPTKAIEAYESPAY